MKGYVLPLSHCCGSSLAKGLRPFLDCKRYVSTYATVRCQDELSFNLWPTSVFLDPSHTSSNSDGFFYTLVLHTQRCTALTLARQNVLLRAPSSGYQGRGRCDYSTTHFTHPSETVVPLIIDSENCGMMFHVQYRSVIASIENEEYAIIFYIGSRLR